MAARQNPSTEKFIPYEKLHKKKQRELDKMKRRDWGAMSPVTRKPENPKAYKRDKVALKKSRTWSDDTSVRDFYLFADIA